MAFYSTFFFCYNKNIILVFLSLCQLFYFVKIFTEVQHKFKIVYEKIYYRIS
ncbi:hypothetical protein Hanom_Chr17g01539691 [Helianthus anomalus]